VRTGVVAVSEKERIISEFELFRGNGGGIEGWFSDNIPEAVVDVLSKCDTQHITLEVFNQLLILSHEGGVSPGFFDFYFLSDPHAKGMCWYNPRRLPEFNETFLKSTAITSLRHLKWGLTRLYIDGLLYFGNIRQCYRTLRTFSKSEFELFFRNKIYNTTEMTGRGVYLSLEHIAKDDRYLIAEVACKTYAPTDKSMPDLIDYFKGHYKEAVSAGRSRIKIKDLISSPSAKLGRYDADQLSFALDEEIDREITSAAELEIAIKPLIDKFKSARSRALKNTKLYLSMVSDLDVYVATSMRSRDDFRAMADFCEQVFSDERIRVLKLRHFDPTLSAADSHEDKGLIECLMVKCAKILIYNAGLRDSYGKDAEAAMALSLGKPVIFYCDTETKRKIFQEVHPLARLINFHNGVAVGSIVMDRLNEVPEMVRRIFENDMEFELTKKADDYFLLCEKMTGSTIRVQSSDLMLREVFWNYYNSQPPFARG
jgi:hypothetical protein